MYRASLRSSVHVATRVLCQPVVATPVSRTTGVRRLASTAATAAKHATWKGAAVRWGLAAGALYWYNTSPIFADEATTTTTGAGAGASVPPAALSVTPHESEFRTVDALLEEKQRQDTEKRKAAKTEKTDKAATATAVDGAEGAVVGGESAGELQEEAGQQGAFNPETGEINWDCPCLGGMAHGPCGEDFKAAFSCFVHSTEEPKGMDCIDKFQHMQDCFRQYPEVYGAEIADDEEGGEAPGLETGEAPADKDTMPAETTATATTTTTTPAESTDVVATSTPAPVVDDVVQADVDQMEKDAAAAAATPAEHPGPRSSYDATGANAK